MAYMTLFILDDPAKLDEVMKSLVDGGIRGATIIESTGLYRHQRRLIPMRYLYTSQEADEKDNLAILTLVEDLATAEKCLQLYESVVGDLAEPNTGVFGAWPLEIVKGIGRREPTQGE